MKKLLFVLLIVALASYLFVGCIPVTPTEGEGEVEGEVEGVTVAIADSAKVGDYTYVSAGPHDITVTFPAPVAGLVSASISPCSGDYTKAFIADGTSVVLFPDATRKIWTGSGTFTATGENKCCASYVEVVSGECSDVVCIAFPVIVDGEAPEATVEVCLADCTCAGCEIVFSSHISTALCAPDEVICGDDCSGLASWAIDIFDRYPFDECCETPCYEPIESGSGVCPIDFTTTCLTDLIPGVLDTVYAVVTLVDNVGNDRRFGATITFNPDICDYITVTPWPADECVDHPTFAVCDVTGLTVNIIDVPDVLDVPDFPANLGTSYGFVILSKSGITNISTSAITGNIGTSPISGTAITGLDDCLQVVGTIYTVTTAGPPCRVVAPTLLTAAVSAMEAAYTAAAGRTNPTATELGDGNIGGMTLAPGLYKWSTDVDIQTDVTLSGGANDVWIFQIAGDLSIAAKGDLASGIKVLLSGGAQASNVFWQVGGATGATLGTYSTFNGTILSAKQIILSTGAVLNGRAWAQSQVTLDTNTIVKP